MGAYDIIGNLQDGRKIAYLKKLLGGTISNGTGIITGAPVTLALGANAITGITKTGTLIITLPSGDTGTAASNGATISGTPVPLVAGVNVITITALGAGTITVTVVCAATAATIEIPGLRRIDAVIDASIDGGYYVEAAAVTIAGNKVTIQPQFFDYTSGASGPAISVPTTTDLSAQNASLVVIGY